MRAKAIGAVLGAVAVAALLIPGAAGATKPTERGSGLHTKAEVSETLEVQGTNGFKVTASLQARHQLEITAEASAPNGQGGQTTTYTLTAPQKRGSDDIKARIGKLGRIDVRFVAQTTKEFPPSVAGCSGGKIVEEKGHFVGSIAFRGEQGYTRVNAHSAAGTIFREPALTCKKEPVPQPGKPAQEKEANPLEEGEIVGLGGIVGHSPVVFSASRISLEVKGHPRVASSFDAVATRSMGKVSELAFAIGFSLKGSGFVLPEPLHPTTGAVITPPFPFSGSATFTGAVGSAEPASWSGDLKVELPGFGTVPLAGKGSHASMCTGQACIEGL